MLQRFYFLSVSVLVDIVYLTYLPNLNTVDFNKPKTNLELSSVKLVSWLAVFFTFISIHQTVGEFTTSLCSYRHAKLLFCSVRTLSTETYSYLLGRKGYWVRPDRWKESHRSDISFELVSERDSSLKFFFPSSLG